MAAYKFTWVGGKPHIMVEYSGGLNGNGQPFYPGQMTYYDEKYCLLNAVQMDKSGPFPDETEFNNAVIAVTSKYGGKATQNINISPIIPISRTDVDTPILGICFGYVSNNPAYRLAKFCEYISQAGHWTVKTGFFGVSYDMNNLTSDNAMKYVIATRGNNFEMAYIHEGWSQFCGPSFSFDDYRFSSQPTPEDFDFENPYADEGPTEPGGGDVQKQNFVDATDVVPLQNLPTIGAVNSRMIQIFAPTSIQVNNLADFLFSYNFFDWLQKDLTNLDQLLLSFGMVPFNVTKGATESITFLGFDISTWAHPIYLDSVAEQYIEMDMGSINLATNPKIHRSDSVFDYSPFSKLGIYLPFIGFQELDIDEFREKTIHLVYRIDLLSGTCIALIGTDLGWIYQFSGNCLTQLPLTSSDISGIVQGAIQIATTAAMAGSTSAVAGGGTDVAAGMAGDVAANSAGTTDASVVSYNNGQLTSASANATMGMKPNFKHTGSIGASGSMMAVKQPYLFLTTPREAVPKQYQKYCGLPSNITSRLGDLSGYTVVEDIRLNGLVATNEEVAEIYSLLKKGVII